MTLLFDTSYLFKRSLKKLIRNPILLFFSLLQPVIFLLLFTQLFNRFSSIPGFASTGTTSYVTFAIAGIVLQNAFSSAFQSGTAVVDDVKSGYLEKMLATPVSRPAILLGRLLTDVLTVCLTCQLLQNNGRPHQSACNRARLDQFVEPADNRLRSNRDNRYRNFGCDYVPVQKGHRLSDGPKNRRGYNRDCGSHKSLL